MHQRLFFSILFLVGLTLTGCIELGKPLGQACDPAAFCSADMSPVCGDDGRRYACAPLAQCENVAINPNMNACDNAPPACQDELCVGDCPAGYAFKFDENGCNTCICEPVGTSCSDPQCAGECPPNRRFKIDENGCQTCECELIEPEQPPGCEVPPPDNLPACPNGYQFDENGCWTGMCADVNGETCAEDTCTAAHCGTSRAACFRPRDLAAMNCGPNPDFLEPEPICDCSGDQCSRTACTADADCPGSGDLCVRTPDSNEPGYCITSTCQQFRSRYYQNLDPGYTSCTQDSDCEGMVMKLYCCGIAYVNETGRQYMEQVNRFVDHTSCGVELTEQCDMDCSMFHYESVCLRGKCEMAP